MDKTLNNVVIKKKDIMSNPVATSKEYSDPNYNDLDGFIVRKEHGTAILEDVINELVTANKSENETENSDMKQQSGKADVTGTDQDEN